MVFELGKGAYLWDVEGTEYTGMLAEIAMNSVGHSHPKLVKSIQEQTVKLTHISNF
ncbi:MAG: acetylornithine/N-succinyldiaminopimelate aminotransferase [Bacteroidia bacterium]